MRGPATGNRLIQPALGIERQTQMGMIGGNLGVLRDRLAQQFSACAMMSFLIGDDAQPVQAVGMAGIAGQDSPVELPGFLQTPFPMALDGAANNCPAPAGPWLGLAVGAALLAVHGV